MRKIYFIITLICVCFSQDCDENMLMFDCDDLGFCNNEPDFGFDCYVNNEFCEDFNQDGITDSWVGDGWCDDGEWGYDFQCEEYSFDCVIVVMNFLIPMGIVMRSLKVIPLIMKEL